jgi:hypothetical protein
MSFLSPFLLYLGIGFSKEDYPTGIIMSNLSIRPSLAVDGSFVWAPDSSQYSTPEARLTVPAVPVYALSRWLEGRMRPT